LLELAVVVTILGILSGLAIPNILQWVALSKIDAAKALLNSAAAECLQGIREGNSPDKISVKETTISNENLNSHGYQIKESDKTCASFFIIPTNEDDNLMYQLGFKINSLGEIVKIAVPASDSASLNSCKNWAGVNCGVSAEQQAVWDALAKIEKDKKTCNDDFYAWLQKPSSGSYNRWNEATKSCTLETWAFEGSIQKDEAAVKSARAAKIGAACTAKLKEKETSKFDGLFTDSECGNTYFCSGKDLATENQTAYNACKEEERQTRCAAALNTWKSETVNGMFNQSGCAAQWKCNGTIYSSETDYNNSQCGYICKMEQVQKGTKTENYTEMTQKCSNVRVGTGSRTICNDIPINKTRTVPVYEMQNVCVKR